MSEKQAKLQEQGTTAREQQREAAKDKRIKMEGTQQSQMIDQRKNDLLPIDFEKKYPDEQANQMGQQVPIA